jgi:hypothetical protein
MNLASLKSSSKEFHGGAVSSTVRISGIKTSLSENSVSEGLVLIAITMKTGSVKKTQFYLRNLLN